MDLSVFENVRAKLEAVGTPCPIVSVVKDFPWERDGSVKEVVGLQAGNEKYHFMLAVPTSCNIPACALAELFHSMYKARFVEEGIEKVKPYATVGAMLDLLQVELGIREWRSAIKEQTPAEDYNDIVEFEFAVNFYREEDNVAGTGLTVIATSQEAHDTLVAKVQQMRQQQSKIGEVLDDHKQLH